MPSPLLVMAWHSPSYFQPGDAELDILANVLAGHAAARLDARLVYGNGGAQETWVGQPSKRGSTFIVSIQGEPEADLASLEAAVHEEIKSIAEDRPPTQEEMAIALNGLEQSFLNGLEGLLERAEALQRYAFYVGEGFGPKEDMERYKSVSAETLSEVIQEWLSPDNLAVIEVHPKKEEESTGTQEGGEE